MTNVEIAGGTNINIGRWRWLRHGLRLSKRRLPQVVLKYTPSRKRRTQTARHMEKDCGGGEEVDWKDMS